MNSKETGVLRAHRESDILHWDLIMDALSARPLRPGTRIELVVSERTLQDLLRHRISTGAPVLTMRDGRFFYHYVPVTVTDAATRVEQAIVSTRLNFFDGPTMYREIAIVHGHWEKDEDRVKWEDAK